MSSKNEKTERTILITGGAGFVGSNIAIKIKQKYPKNKVICLDNLKRRGSELNLTRLKDNGIIFFHGDIRNKEDLNEIGSFDAIIECSAEPSVMAGIDSTPDYLINTNLVGTINCLEAARKNNANFIFLSTSRVYPIDPINSIKYSESETRFVIDKKQNITGITEKGISEEFTLSGQRSLYGTTKLCSELILQEYIEYYNMKGVINRCGVITGPWQMGKIDQGVFVLWVARHIYGGKLSYIGFDGLGKQVRDFVHIDDLFDLVDMQINDIDKFNGQIFNVGGGLKNSVSLIELTKACEKATGKKIKIDSVKETRKADIRFYITDYSKINKLSGWTPKKGLDETIKEIAKWVEDNKDLLKNILS